MSEITDEQHFAANYNEETGVDELHTDFNDIVGDSSTTLTAEGEDLNLDVEIKETIENKDNKEEQEEPKVATVLSNDKSREDNIINKNTFNKEGQFPCYPAPPLETKLFVGRIPHTYSEDMIWPIFEEYGKVLGVNIIRDRFRNHKGSAFVRMACLAEADEAARALSNKKVLDDKLGPLLVKYAAGEMEKLGIIETTAEEGQDYAKLFVGSIPKTLNEDGIRELFGPYGDIDEIYIMKDISTGISKGCAFVKYKYKEQAIYASNILNHKKTFPECMRPLEVRLASRNYRPQSSSLQSGAFSSPTTRMAGGASPTSMMGSASAGSSQGGSFGLQRGPYGSAAGMPSAYSSVPYSCMTPGQSPYAASGAISTATPKATSVWKEYFNEHGRPYYHNEVTNITQWEKPAEFDQQNSVGTPTQTGASNVAYGLNANTPTKQSVSTIDGSIGPPGANIFVFHLPHEWTQSDLITAFSPFGLVKNAKIAKDSATNTKPKGYGFVSYDNLNSAVTAVKHMNGFSWGGKKLKVAIKKGEEKYVEHLFSSTNSCTSSSKADANDSTMVGTNAGAAATSSMTDQNQATNYAMYNGVTDMSAYQMANSETFNKYAAYQSQLAGQYNLQAVTPVIQYGIYGVNRYTPY